MVGSQWYANLGLSFELGEEVRAGQSTLCTGKLWCSVERRRMSYVSRYVYCCIHLFRDLSIEF